MGDPRIAIHFSAAAETGLPYIQLILLPVLRSAYQDALSEARIQLGEAGFASAWAEGQGFTREQEISRFYSE